MTKRQRNEATGLIHAREFAEQREPDFAASKPATKAKHTATLAKLSAAIAEFGGKAALQAAGEFGEETDRQEVLREDVEDAMGDLNEAVATIAEDQENPALMARFRMPRGASDEDLRTALRAFADAIEELGLADELDALGEELTPASLRTMADDFAGSEGRQGDALSRRSGARAALPGILRQGRTAVRTLTVMYRRRYRGNAEMLAAWKTASHVERDGGPKEEQPPAKAA